MLLDEILQYNQQFVENKMYTEYETDKFPSKKAVILTCMDARLLDLLPRSINFKNGDAKVIRNAGGFITDPEDSTMKSILVALHALKGEEVFVIGHKSCGMHGLHGDDLLTQMETQGADVDRYYEEAEDREAAASWLDGFSSVEKSVADTAALIKSHPLLPSSIPVHALVIDPATGKLDLIVNGYN